MTQTKFHRSSLGQFGASAGTCLLPLALVSVDAWGGKGMIGASAVSVVWADYRHRVSELQGK